MVETDFIVKALMFVERRLGVCGIWKCFPLLNVFLFAGRLSMSLVMEYLPNGSLIGYMESNRHNVNIRRMLLFASQICKVRVRHTVYAELLNGLHNKNFKST